MTDSKNTTELTDILNTESQLNEIKNTRVATRFVRQDISVFIASSGLLGFSKNQFQVSLLDITSKGVLVATDQKLAINKKIKLTLVFKSGKSFEIDATVARHTNNEYGIKFDHFNNALGDYLIETQDKLVFK